MITLKQLKEEIASVDEAKMKDVKNLKVGKTIHPYKINYAGFKDYKSPHEIVKHYKDKTVIKDDEGRHFTVSHHNGDVKQNSSVFTAHGYHAFSDDNEKTHANAERQAAMDKNQSHNVIMNHLQNLTNHQGDVIGKLSDDQHASILSHLEKLRK